MFIGTKGGNVVEAPSAIRVVEQSQWSPSAIQNIVGTPGNRCPLPGDKANADDIEGTENPHDYDPADVPDTEAAARAATDRESPTCTGPKRMKITKEFIDKCGQTPGGIKCAHIELGRKPTAAHSEECHQRM